MVVGQVLMQLSMSLNDTVPINWSDFVRNVYHSHVLYGNSADWSTMSCLSQIKSYQKSRWTEIGQNIKGQGYVYAYKN